MKYRRINIFAGPCSGKSTVCANIFYELKCKGFDVEQIQEYIKIYAYQKKQVKGFDQLQVFTEQLKKEENPLQFVNVIVTDCPILLNCFYSKYRKFPYHKQLLEIALMFEEEYPSLNFFLNRIDIEYKNNGRFESEKEAIEVDEQIIKFLDSINVNYEFVNHSNVVKKVLFGLEK